MTDPTQTIATVRLSIDGEEITVPKGTTVYNAARKLGIEIPIFCYQDRMPPFGACRVCLVEVEKMNKPQASCTLEATDGMVVKTQSHMAVDGRRSILELLLINHPLDCPICDRAGECPLQDQAQRFGPGESRFFEDKRRFTKPLPMGPVLMLDRERCIACARCTRFGEIVAGDHALQFIDRGYKTEVGTLDGGTPESKFIGNTIMLCPVGALTSQVYRFRARPWDNEHTPSTCTLCPVGCSMTIDSRDGEIMRTRMRENREVNDIWLCDKGWFGYEFTYSSERLQRPLIKREGNLEPVSWDEAISFVAKKIVEAKPNKRLAAFGGNPLTTEENYSLQKLMRDGASINNLDHRIGMSILSIEEEGLPPGMDMNMGDCEDLSLAILFGLDLTEEFPVIWLRLNQAINRGATVLYFGNYTLEISKHLSKNIIHAPGQEIDTIKKYLTEIESLSQNSKKSAIFVGSQYLNAPNRLEILDAITNLKQSMPNTSLNIMEGHGNSVGARFAGMRPDFGPMGKALSTPGLNAIQVLEEASHKGWDFLYVVGANPALKYPSTLWQEARSKTKCLVVQDLFMTETAMQADVVLPTLAFIEKRGSFINIEGRVQKLHPGKEIPPDIYSDGEIFEWIAQKLSLSLKTDPAFLEALDEKKIQIPRNKHKVKPKSKEQSDTKGLLRATFVKPLFDHGVRMLHNSHLVELAKTPYIRLHPEDCRKLNLHDKDEVVITSKGQTISGVIKSDEAIAIGTALLPLGFPELPLHDLALQLQTGLPISISKKGKAHA